MYRPRNPNEIHPVDRRLELLLDKENLCTDVEYIGQKREDNPNCTYKDAKETYNYLIVPTEFSANLHPLVEYNQRHGKQGIINYESIEEFEKVLEDDSVKHSWVYDIYHYLVKDKERFLRTINKYAFLLPVIVDISNLVS